MSPARLGPAADPPALHRRPAWFAGVAITTTALLAYHRTFQVPFLMDDLPSIVDNPTIRSLWRSWIPPGDSGLTVSGRPLLNVTLAINYAISGTEVWSYHAFNLLLHVLTGGLLFGLIRRIFLLPRLAPRFGAAATTLALGISVLWTVHPLQTESVTYVIQRAEILAGFCYLLTFYSFIRASGQPQNLAWKAAAVTSCLAGMAAKEVMVSAPIMLLLFDRIFLSSSWTAAWQARGRLHLTLAATWILLVLLISASGARGGTVGFASRITPADYALTQTYAITTYLRLAIWPVGQVFDYGVPQAVAFSEIAPEFAAFLLVAFAAVLAAWRAPAAGFCCLFFFGVLAPTSSFIPVVTQTMTEHRMYLALAAVVALAVALMHRTLGRHLRPVLAAITALLAAATWQRNESYRSDLALWEDTVAKRPDNLRAHLNIGMIHYRIGNYAEAAAAYRRVLDLDPNMVEAANNLGNSLLRLGRLQEAAAHLQHALRFLEGRERAVALTNLGNVLLQTGRTEEALVRLEEAARLAPDLAEARYNLANTLALAGRASDALPHYEAALRVRPEDSELRSNLASVLMEIGRTTEAIRELLVVVRLSPDSAQAHNNLGAAFALSGRPAEARLHFRRAIELKPGFLEARENLVRAERALDSLR